MGKEFDASIPARVIASAMLFLALLHWPYSYYRILRWVVCAVCTWSAFLAVESKETRWAWAMGITAVFFNPILPFYLSRNIWSVIDVVAGILLLVSLRFVKESVKANDDMLVSGPDVSHHKYYDVLGIRPGASREELKEAYRDLVEQWRTDRFNDDPEMQARAIEKIRKMNEAYDWLESNVYGKGTRHEY